MRSLRGGVIGIKKKSRKNKKKLCSAQRPFAPIPNSYFKEFVQHSRSDYLHKGTYGAVFKLTLDDANLDHSKYVNLDGSPVRTIIVKIGVVSDSYDSFKILKHNRSLSLASVDRDQFENEVDTQKDIYKKSLTQFNFALCPNIVYSDIMTVRGLSKNFRNLANLLVLPAAPSFRICLIAMETYASASSLFDLQSKVTESVYIIMRTRVVYMLMKLAVIGYYHGDPSKANVLVVDRERPYLIDFGETKKLGERVSEDCMDHPIALFDTSRIRNQILQGYPMTHATTLRIPGDRNSRFDNWDWLLRLQTYDPPSVGPLSDPGWENIS